MLDAENRPVSDWKKKKLFFNGDMVAFLVDVYSTVSPL
jgi:hypothetical protein